MKEWVVMELVQMFALPVLILILSIWVINLSTDGKLVKNKLITNTALVFAFYVLAMISPNGDLETIIFMASGSLIAISINTRKLMDKQRSEEHTSELQSRDQLVSRLLLEIKKVTLLQRTR